jgi:hypothetical protein
MQVTGDVSEHLAELQPTRNTASSGGWRGAGPRADRRVWRTHRQTVLTRLTASRAWRGGGRRPGTGPVQPTGIATSRPPGVRSSAHAVWTSPVIPS